MTNKIFSAGLGLLCLFPENGVGLFFLYMELGWDFFLLWSIDTGGGVDLDFFELNLAQSIKS